MDCINLYTKRSTRERLIAGAKLWGSFLFVLAYVVLTTVALDWILSGFDTALLIHSWGALP